MDEPHLGKKGEPHVGKKNPSAVLGTYYIKGTLLGTPNREPREYSRNIMEYQDPGRYIRVIFLHYVLGVPCLGIPVKSLYYVRNVPKPLATLPYCTVENRLQ